MHRSSAFVLALVQASWQAIHDARVRRWSRKAGRRADPGQLGPSWVDLMDCGLPSRAS